MIYRVIGLMSGSSLDGLDIVFTELNENAGKWTYEIKNAACYEYSPEWQLKLRNATSLNALEYQLLHTTYGHYLGEQVNQFIEENNLHFQVAFIVSHGHTTFHIPGKKMTAQLGDGAAIAAETQLPVITDLRAMDIAFGGQGAPIVPIGEKLLMKEYEYFLNIGGIANISFNGEPYIAFDVCPANRVLNMLANDAGAGYDAGGEMARAGKINKDLLSALNKLEYYKQPFPKSLANEFGTEMVYPLIKKEAISINDALCTYTEHIVMQITLSIEELHNDKPKTTNDKLLVTGGGAFNTFLVEQLSAYLQEQHISVVIPDERLVKYKEALIMAFIGALRWRQEYTTLASVTGATRNSIGGALWIGQEA